MNKFSPREAVCQYMGWCFEDSSDHRYHYGKTTTPIYSTPNGYVCALANGKALPKSVREYMDVEFIEATGSQADYCKSRGYTVWISK